MPSSVLQLFLYLPDPVLKALKPKIALDILSVLIENFTQLLTDKSPSSYESCNDGGYYLYVWDH